MFEVTLSVVGGKNTNHTGNQYLKPLRGMKNRVLFIVLFFLCNGAFGQAGMWTWMNGDSTNNSLGSFGTQGVSSPTNEPPAFYEAAEFKDLQGNFWLFGGLGPTFETYGDLWKYNPLINEWTWIKGTGNPLDSGNCGTMGIPSTSNLPSSRAWGIATWVDLNGDFWLYGGNTRNDLWKYNIATNTWTWMNGSTSTSQPANYGTLGIPSPSNTPGARSECNATWVDNYNNLWLFSGNNGTSAYLNDLWKFDPLINQWTWMKGSNVAGQSGIYGTKGFPDPSNTPGARWTYCHWKDNNGNFWLFGGGFLFNDMWMFNPNSNNWCWMSGTNLLNDPGNYGTQCIPSIYNLPPARFENRCFWNDLQGRFWLYGGGGGGPGVTNLSDLWVFNPSTLEWTFTSGDTIYNQPHIYGTLGIPSVLNKPGSRNGHIGWYDNGGFLYLFGGRYIDSSATQVLNDLWRYEIDISCPQIITSIPISNFQSSDSTICQNHCINFLDLSLNYPTSWQWFFQGSNTTTSTLKNPTNICYNTPGTYDVTLIGCNAAGCDTLVLSNFINVLLLPSPVITTSLDTLYSSLAGTYQWWSVSSGMITGATNNYYVPAQSGNYFVIVTDSLGCPGISDTISVTALIPSVNLMSSDTSFCEKHCLNFFDLSTNNPTSWQWFFPGADSSTSSLQDPTNICYNSYGSYDVTLIACNAAGCDTLHLTNFITCYQNPTDSIYQSNDTLFSLPAYSYQWYEVTNGLIAGATNQYYVPQGQGSYYCVATDSIGCAGSSGTIVITGLTPLSLGEGPGVRCVPNPNDGAFEIVFSDGLQIKNYELVIYDAIGRIAFKSQSKIRVMPNKVEVLKLNLDPGIYFVEVISEGKVFRKKMIVKN